MLPAIRQRWYQTHSKFLSNQIVANSRSARFTAITKFVRVSVQSLILGVAAYLVINGSVTSGMMIAASILLGRALAPVEQIIAQWRQFTTAFSAYNRLQVLLDDNPERVAKMSLPRPKGRISAEEITSGVLRSISFNSEPGDCVGIIGPSGSGKTTLAKLLVGVAEPEFGVVRLDGADMQQWNRDELGPNIGYLPQDIELFAGTIAENIARFNQIDSTKVIQAAELAGVHDMILQMPSGYETQLGINGAGLSGGQRQRVALARALYNNPSIVILDEPNSNLDVAGDRALSEAIEKLRLNNVTVVIVTHRTDIIDQTSKVLVLNQGQLVNFGPTKEILNNFINSFNQSTKQKV
jgi:ATP-binding cassette subfamily C exporter for protease/lipase